MRQRASQGSVILGENDPLMRSIVRSILLQMDLEAFLAADGQEAVLLAGQFQARLVLLDIGMPRMNGLLACQAIRLLPGYAAVPIIMLTGYGDARMRQAAAQVGATDFITKPFRPDMLLARLAAHLGLPASMAAGGPAARAQRWPARQEPGSDRLDGVEMENGRRILNIWRDVSERR